MQLSQKRQVDSQIFFAFSKFWFTVEHFQTNVIFIGDVFFNLRTPKDGVR